VDAYYGVSNRRGHVVNIKKAEIEPSDLERHGELSAIYFPILNKITTRGLEQTKESGSESDSDYFTADEGDAVEEPEEDQVGKWWNVKDFYQFQCRDGTVWLLPRYYDPETGYFSLVNLHDKTHTCS